ncbi:Solute Carrier Organic Anion Transporter Family Member 5A1 [Manis pentadactyla]|nr:Solute Carrier Organic Anion Transporter Family Member 5A1 [Manis pentadactyla]
MANQDSNLTHPCNSNKVPRCGHKLVGAPQLPKLSFQRKLNPLEEVFRYYATLAAGDPRRKGGGSQARKAEAQRHNPGGSELLLIELSNQKEEEALHHQLSGSDTWEELCLRRFGSWTRLKYPEVHGKRPITQNACAVFTGITDRLQHPDEGNTQQSSALGLHTQTLLKNSRALGSVTETDLPLQAAVHWPTLYLHFWKQHQPAVREKPQALAPPNDPPIILICP